MLVQWRPNFRLRVMPVKWCTKKSTRTRVALSLWSQNMNIIQNLLLNLVVSKVLFWILSLEGVNVKFYFMLRGVRVLLGVVKGQNEY